jgi:hypothetical protein
MTERKICFVIAPIGDENSDTWRRNEMVFQNVIKPAARKCGYSAVRSMDITQAGLITNEIIRHIVSDPLVIADLTDGNPNVFYELGLRHAVRKPVVQIVLRGQKIPFNVMDTRTISFDIDEIHSTKSAVEDIVKQIRDIERNASPFETPVSISGINIHTSFPDIERTLPTAEGFSLVIKPIEDSILNLQGLTPAEAIPVISKYIEDLRNNPRIHLLGAPIDDLDAACTLIANVPDGGYISATSSLQGEDSDERMSYRTAVNQALERNVTHRKIICSNSELTSERHETWLGEFTDKADLIREGRIKPDAFQLLHYPAPISVDVLISQDSNGECLEIVAGFAGGVGRGGFYTSDRRIVENWLGVYLEKKIIVEAELHTKTVLDGREECSCLEFLKLLGDARQEASRPEPVLRNTRPKRRPKSLIR